MTFCVIHVCYSNLIHCSTDRDNKLHISIIKQFWLAIISLVNAHRLPISLNTQTHEIYINQKHESHTALQTHTHKHASNNLESINSTLLCETKSHTILLCLLVALVIWAHSRCNDKHLCGQWQATINKLKSRAREPISPVLWVPIVVICLCMQIFFS